MSYFKPDFTLGLTATPERADGEDLLEIFRNVAHKLDLKSAVEAGTLVPVRCIRIKTNIDMRDVRISGFRYNAQDLESVLHVPARNELLVNTWCEYVQNKPTVVFCASVAHAQEIADLFKERGVEASCVSGKTPSKETSATGCFNDDTPLSALFRKTHYEELRKVIDSWRPYLIGNDVSVDAVAMTHFEFDKNRIYSNKVYRDLCELDAIGALHVSLNQLAHYLADHSNLSRSYATLYQQLKYYRCECD